MNPLEAEAARGARPVGTGSSLIPALRSAISTSALQWQDRAACAQIGTEMFFQERGEADIVRAAKGVCARCCPVQPECLEYALEMEARPAATRHGIFGGTTPNEREVIARSRKQAAA